jgi:putative ABC transport system permease protein
MDSALRDLRYAFRSLMRMPGFSVAAALTLAIGIGASTAIFGVIDTALLAPLPFREADRLVTLRGSFRSQPAGGSITPADFVDFRTRTQSFESLAAAMPSTGRVNFTGSGEPEQIRGFLVTGNFFQTLGVTPLLGPGLAARDDQVFQPSVVVLSHGFWQRRFASDPTIVGREILLDGHPCRIVGVMPPGVEFQNPDVWAPLPFLDSGFTTRAAHFLRPVGRLKPGITLARAQGELDVIAASLAREYPETNLDWGVRATALRDEMVGTARPTLRMLATVVGFVLLLSCANVSGLFLIRNSRRRHEIAVRLSLGASRGTIARLVIAEGFLLAIIGTGLAVAASLSTNRLLIAAIPGVPSFLNPDRTRILIFASLVSMVTALAVSLVPSLHVSRQTNASLKSGSRHTSGSARRVLSVLAVGQLAVALVLISGTALIVSSFQKLLAVPVGVDPQAVTTVRLSVPSATYKSPEQVRAFFSDVIERIEVVRGVEAVSLIDTLPLGGVGNDNWFTIRERPPEDPQAKVTADYRQVDSRYFETLRIPILRGRPFTRQEAASRALVVIISDGLAKRFIPNEDPLGQHVVTGNKAYEIVGVAADVLHRGLNQPPYQTLYVPAHDVPETTLVVRSALDAGSLATVIRQSVREIDRDLPVPDVRPMSSVIGASVERRRITTSALTLIAIVALLIAAVGVYGVIALTVAERTREIGIRTALGATSTDMRRLVIGHGLMLAAAAIAIGTPLALLSARASTALLFEVQPYEPVIFAGMTATLACVALLASYIPARRASKIDPALLLRTE